jgi:GTPase KRas protein
MVEVLDTGGQEEYTALRDQWIRDGEGFVLVYSISSRSSFARIEKFHNQIQRVKKSSQASSPQYLRAAQHPSSPSSAPAIYVPAPVMLVGNNCDKVAEREVSVQEGSGLARKLGCEFVEASPKNGINVRMAFYDVVRQIRRQQRTIAQLTKTS